MPAPLTQLSPPGAGPSPSDVMGLGWSWIKLNLLGARVQTDPSVQTVGCVACATLPQGLQMFAKLNCVRE